MTPGETGSQGSRWTELGLRVLAMVIGATLPLGGFLLRTHMAVEEMRWEVRRHMEQPGHTSSAELLRALERDVAVLRARTAAVEERETMILDRLEKILDRARVR